VVDGDPRYDLVLAVLEGDAAVNCDPNSLSNWLPVAKEPFSLMLRLYSPRSDILDGTWTPPLVRTTDAATTGVGGR
jgi:hypothetical protein